MPANLLQSFQILISIVSFDYLKPFEYLDVNFTELWAWSPNFEWLDYDSVQFLPELGSIAIFAAIQLFMSLIALGVMTCRLKLPF